MAVCEISERKTGFTARELEGFLQRSLREIGRPLRKVLIIPPDATRLHSGAGALTYAYYKLLKDVCPVDILPALGTHEGMGEAACKAFFGAIPYGSVLEHDWRNEIVQIGQVPKEFVHEVSEGLVSDPIDVEVNRRLLDPSYDLILSIGQVVPHEVAGMANYSKNIFVGVGGSKMINSTHFLGAVYGMERIMGRDRTPVRRVFDFAEDRFLKKIPIQYALTVTTQTDGKTAVNGLFIGRERRLFEEAVRLSQEKNVTFLEEPLKKAVVYLDEGEFTSTWLGNKAIYRTRMAIADGGELVILAPGVKKFGEDSINDVLIRKYGYVGRHTVLERCRTNRDLQENLSVAAHLMHGSSDGRFSVVYATEKLSRTEVNSVSFRHACLGDMAQKYDPGKLREGYNTLESGEKIYYISNPALGLWTASRFPLGE